MTGQRKKMTYVEFRFADGTVQTISGEEAEKWSEAMKAINESAWVHGVRMPSIKWQHGRIK